MFQKGRGGERVLLVEGEFDLLVPWALAVREKGLIPPIFCRSGGAAKGDRPYKILADSDGSPEGISQARRKAIRYARTRKLEGTARADFLAEVAEAAQARPQDLLDDLLGEQNPDEELAQARQLLSRIQTPEHLRAALESPEILKAIAQVARLDRAAYEAQLLRLRDCGGQRWEIEALQRAINAELKKHQSRQASAELEEGESSALPRVGEALADVPEGTQGLLVPRGWRLPEEGIFRATLDNGTGLSFQPVSPTPILITGRLKDAFEGTESVRLSWERDGRWQHTIADRAVVANVKKIVDLAGLGLPVTSRSAGDLVDWLAAFETVNLPKLARALVSRQMGWQGPEGKKGFLWGRTLIRPDATLAESPEPFGLSLDDTKRARRSQDIAQTLYDVAAGRGRGRGSVRGTRAAGSWETILFSSGEAPIDSFTQSEGGNRARVVKVWGAPFGRADETTILVVRELNLAIRQHYGHAGPRFVQFLLKNRDRWKVWKEEFVALQRQYSEQAGANPVADRIVEHLAVITLTARLAHQALELPWQYRDPIAPLWKDLLEEVSEADRAARALEYVMSWAYAHEGEFFGRHRVDHNGKPLQPLPGWAGRWDEEESWEAIAFHSHKLRELLVQAGFEPEPTLLSGEIGAGWRPVEIAAGMVSKSGSMAKVPGVWSSVGVPPSRWGDKSYPHTHNLLISCGEEGPPTCVKIFTTPR